jgi:hypothetical protein
VCDRHRAQPGQPVNWRLQTGPAKGEEGGGDLPVGADATKPMFFVTSVAKWWRHAYVSAGALLAEEADQLPVFWNDAEEGALVLNATAVAQAAATAPGELLAAVLPADAVTAFGLPSPPQHRPPPLCPSHRSHRMISRLVMPACSAAAGANASDASMQWLRAAVAPAAVALLPPASASSEGGWSVGDVVCEARVAGHTSPPHAASAPGGAAGRSAVAGGEPALPWDRGTSAGARWVWQERGGGDGDG